MNSFSVAIIDDEADARFLLRQSLESQFQRQLAFIAEADSVSSGKALLSTQRIDLVFLDIKMKDGTGFQLLEALPDIQFTVVFVTAYSNFALRAFDFFTFAYLVKPFKTTELASVVERFQRERLPSQATSIRLLTESMARNTITKMVIAEMEGFLIINIQDILYLKSDSNYTEFLMKDGSRHIGSKSLKEYDQALKSEGFYRVHRSYLINLNAVKSYSRHDATIELRNGDMIPLGRRRMAGFKQLFLG